MNTPAKLAELETALQTLPGLGYFDDDIHSQLTETAKSITQDIVDLLGSQYSEARKPNTLPRSLWKPLRIKAYEITAAHFESIAAELKEAANDPRMQL